MSVKLSLADVLHAKSDQAALRQRARDAYAGLEQGKECPDILMSRLEARLRAADMQRAQLDPDCADIDAEIKARSVRGTVRYVIPAAQHINALPKNIDPLNRRVQVAAIRRALKCGGLLEEGAYCLSAQAEAIMSSSNVDAADIQSMRMVGALLEANAPKPSWRERMGAVIKKAVENPGVETLEMRR